MSLTSPGVAATDRYHEIASGLLRISHDFSRPSRRLGRIHLRPSIDVGVLRLSAKAAHETGAGAQGLILPASTETHGWALPRLTAACEYTTPSGVGLRPFVSLGVQYLLNRPETEVRASLQGAPAGVDPMVLPIDLDNGALQVDAGIEIVATRGLAVQLGYRRLSARGVHADSGNIKATIPF